MNVEHLTRSFERIGARLEIGQLKTRLFEPARVLGNRIVRPARTYDLDIAGRGRDEHFVLRLTPHTPDMRVLQTDAPGRHLLLHTSEGRNGGERFLCGHDERHWFVAGVQGRVSSITDARRALLPRGLSEAGLTPDDLRQRRNGAFIRQGEWFFIPTDKQFDRGRILRDEPLMRGRGSKPHRVEELVRFGGAPVVLFRGHEYTPEVFDAMLAAGRVAHRGLGAQRMVKDPEVYARGRVRHPDHATIVLPFWHRVMVNAETRSVNLSFYD